MNKFTKEQLVYWSQTQPLAAFALTMLDQNEALLRDKIQLGEERAAEWKRAENAEAERDRIKGELEEAEEALREADHLVGADRVSDVARCGFRQMPAVHRARERGGRGGEPRDK